jgi:hypothetical protein
MSPALRVASWWLLALLVPTALPAQTVRLAAFGAAATNSEGARTRQAKGLGLGLAARAERDRFRLDARFLHANLQADFSIQPDYDVNELDLVLTYVWRSFLAGQVGFARRFVSPAFVAQDVGLMRIGVISETRVARIASFWLRGAYLPISHFSGGGSMGLGLEMGLGAEVGSPDGRLQGTLEFEYQRIDRDAAAPAPLQFSVGLAGIRIRL